LFEGKKEPFIPNSGTIKKSQSMQKPYKTFVGILSFNFAIVTPCTKKFNLWRKGVNDWRKGVQKALGWPLKRTLSSFKIVLRSHVPTLG